MKLVKYIGLKEGINLDSFTHYLLINFMEVDKPYLIEEKNGSYVLVGIFTVNLPLPKECFKDYNIKEEYSLK